MTMHPPRASGSFDLAAALAPLAYLLLALSAAVAFVQFMTFFVDLSAKGYLGISKRLTQIFLLAALPLTLATGLPREWIHLRTPPDCWRHHLGRGALLGSAMLGGLVLVLLVLEVRGFRPERLRDPLGVPWLVLKSLLTASVVAGLEELLFRGVLLGWLARRIAMPAAVLLSAFYFAWLHFYGRGLDIAHLPESLPDAFALVPAAMAASFDPAHGSAFLALLLAGIFLALVRLAWPGGLAWCCGIHLGWVFAIKTAHGLTRFDAASPMAPLVNAYDGVTGYLGAGLMAGAILLLYRRVGAERWAALGTPPVSPP